MNEKAPLCNGSGMSSVVLSVGAAGSPGLGEGREELLGLWVRKHVEPDTCTDINKPQTYMSRVCGCISYPGSKRGKPLPTCPRYRNCV